MNATVLANHAQADGPAARTSRSRLFNGSAFVKAEQRHRGSRAERQSGAVTGTGQVGQAAELDTVTEILQDHRSGAEFFSDFRTPFYLAYVSDVVPIGGFEDWDSRSTAQKVFIYQAANEISKALVNSALEPLYRQALEGIRWFRDYTSVKFRQKDDGSLRVGNSSDREKPLLELKLNVSANNGIEPRLKIGNNFCLRYDLIHDETVAEFRQNF